MDKSVESITGNFPRVRQMNAKPIPSIIFLLRNSSTQVPGYPRHADYPVLCRMKQPSSCFHIPHDAFMCTAFSPACPLDSWE